MTHGATRQRGTTHSADSMLHGNAMVMGSSVLQHDTVAHMVQPDTTQRDTVCNTAHCSTTTTQHSASHGASQRNHDTRWRVMAQPDTTQRHTARKTAHRSMTTTQRGTSHGPSQHDHDTSRHVTQRNLTRHDVMQRDTWHNMHNVACKMVQCRMQHGADSR